MTHETCSQYSPLSDAEAQAIAYHGMHVLEVRSVAHKEEPLSKSGMLTSSVRRIART